MTNQFLKDVIVQKNRGRDLTELRARLVEVIASNGPLPKGDHPLGGGFVGYRICQVEPEWTLFYKRQAENLFFVRTGSPADLFLNQ